MLVLAAACGRLGFDPTGDGGASDGMTDAFVVSLCPGDGSGARVCDGFESPSLASRWLYDTEQGTATASTVRAYRGNSSLYTQTDQITKPTLYPRASLQTYDGLPVIGSINLRVFVYLTAPTVSNFVQLINFANEAGVGISMGVRNGKVVNNDYTDMIYAESTTVFPTDRWVCVVFKVPSDTTDTVRIYLDDIEVTDVALMKITAQPPPTHLYLGLDWPNMYTNLPPSSAWFDELIIDDVSTNCAQ